MAIKKGTGGSASKPCSQTAYFFSSSLGCLDAREVSLHGLLVKSREKNILGAEASTNGLALTGVPSNISPHSLFFLSLSLSLSLSFRSLVSLSFIISYPFCLFASFVVVFSCCRFHLYLSHPSGWVRNSCRAPPDLPRLPLARATTDLRGDLPPVGQLKTKTLT